MPETLPIQAGNWSSINDYLAGDPVKFNATYGGVPDCQVVSDGATSGTSLTSATGLFKASDVGKTVLVSGAGAAGVDLVTTIAGFVSATSVTLAVAASTSVTNAVTAWGTDNTSAFNAAFTAMTTTLVGGRLVGGGTLQLAAGGYLTRGGHSWPKMVQVQGHGCQATWIQHVGNNTCFLHDNGNSVTNYMRSGFRALTLWGNNLSSAVGIEMRGRSWGDYLEYVIISNYANGIGLLLNNVNAGDFVEGVSCIDLDLRYNAIGVQWRRTGGNSSFAYQRFLNFDIHVPANGIGMDIGNATTSSALCQLYSGRFSGNIWMEGNNGVAVNVGQFGDVEANTVWNMNGEVISGTGQKALAIASGGIFTPRGTHDFAVSDAAVQLTMDVANATRYKPPTRTDERMAAQGIFAETLPRSMCQGTTILTAGTIQGAMVHLRRGDVVQGVAVVVSVVSTGATLVKVCLSDLSGNLLASSADNSAAFNAGPATLAIKTNFTAPYTVPSDGGYYVEILSVGGTPPTVLRGVSLAAAGAAAVGSGALPFEQSAGGKTDVGNHSVNATGFCLWAGLY